MNFNASGICQCERLEDRRLLAATLFNTPVALSAEAPFTGPPRGVAVADVNGDHKLDLIYANLGNPADANSSDGGVGVYLGKGNNQYKGPRILATDTSPVDVAAADLDGDGIVDLAVGAYLPGDTSSTVTFYKGRGDGRFDYIKRVTGFQSLWRVISGDFNGDAKPDIAVTDVDQGTVTIILNNGGGSFSKPRQFDGGGGPSGIATADLNGDGRLDLAIADVGHGGTGTDVGVSVLYGNGDGKFQAPLTYGAGSRPIGVAIADLNHDKLPDLLVVNGGDIFASDATDSVTVLLRRKSSGSYKLLHSYATLGSPHDVATGDFNGDGNIDAVVANSNSSKLSLFLGNGDGTMQPARNFRGAPGADRVIATDLNADGKLDLVVNGFFDATIDFLLHE